MPDTEEGAHRGLGLRRARLQLVPPADRMNLHPSGRIRANETLHAVQAGRNRKQESLEACVGDDARGPEGPGLPGLAVAVRDRVAWYGRSFERDRIEQEIPWGAVSWCW